MGVDVHNTHSTTCKALVLVNFMSSYPFPKFFFPVVQYLVKIRLSKQFIVGLLSILTYFVHCEYPKGSLYDMEW